MSSTPNPTKKSTADTSVDDRLVEIYGIITEIHKRIGLNHLPETPVESSGMFLGYQPYGAGILGSAPAYGATPNYAGTPGYAPAAPGLSPEALFGTPAPWHPAYSVPVAPGARFPY